MTLEQILAELERMNDERTRITISSSMYDKEWDCTIYREAAGIELQAKGSGASMGEAVRQAHKRWVSAVYNGLPEMVPAIEYQPPAPPSTLDDEIPF